MPPGLRQGVPVFEEDWRCGRSMTKTEKLDKFLKRTGIELLPFQREMLSQMADENKIYICYPPHVGRTNTILLMRALGAIFEKGENDAELHI